MPRGSSIPEDLRHVLLETIESVANLESVLLLKSQGGAWTASRLSEALGFEESEAADCLDELCRRDLLARGPDESSFQYRPGAAELEAAVDRLAALYESEPVAVLDLLTQSALQRIRLSAAKTFADAFRFRSQDKDKKDG